MKRVKGSNQHVNKYGLKKDVVWSLVKLFIFMVFGIAVIQAVRFYSRIAFYEWRDQNVIAPCPDFCANNHLVFAMEKPNYDLDELVDKFSNKYGKTTYLKNRTKAMIHYLLLRETNYGNSTGMGDGGLAGGPLQFHESTYVANSKRMMLLGLRDHVGTRFDLQDSIEVCAWMINQGQENQWGPIYRGEGF